MRPPRLAVVLAAAFVHACGIFGPSDTPPEFIRFEIVEQAACGGCPLTGPRVTPAPDGSLTLRRNSHYIFRNYVRTSERTDRCVYRMVGANWMPLGHDFECRPGRGAEVAIDENILTSDVLIRNHTEWRITVGLAEYETDTRRMLSDQDLFEFPVRFVP